jgi:class 3 adenylate cyclase
VLPQDAQDHNVYGGPVNIVSGICAFSAPSEVLVSDTVRSLASTSAGVAFEDPSKQPLKAIEEPGRVFAVRPGGVKGVRPQSLAPCRDYPAAETIVRAASSNVIVSVLTTRS